MTVHQLKRSAGLAVLSLVLQSSPDGSPPAASANGSGSGGIPPGFRSIAETGPQREGGDRAEAAGAVTVELSTVGVDPTAGTPIVLLREPESGRIVPIWIGPSEAQAIARALHGVRVPRPMTHDLMANLLSELKAEVQEVIVHDLRGATYFATIRLRIAESGTVRDIDSRPSDALALALRTDAPIRIARRILTDAPAFDFTAPEGPDQIVQVLGITVVSPTPDLREKFRLPDRPGVLVTNVFGRAREQGLRSGDLIVAINGRHVATPMQVFESVRGTTAGASVRVTYWRGGREHDISLPARTLPDRPRRGTTVVV